MKSFVCSPSCEVLPSELVIDCKTLILSYLRTRALMTGFLIKKVKCDLIFHHESRINREKTFSRARKRFRAISAKFQRSIFNIKGKMASASTSGSKAKKGSEMLVKGVEWKASNFKIVPTIAQALDPHGAQSQIPPKVLLINDIRTHFSCTVQEIGTLDMDTVFSEFCVDGALKLEFKHLETKGLTHIPHLPRNFQVKWIRYILSRVHNG